MDWNGDGHTDGKDSALFHTEIMNSGGGGGSGGSSGGGSGCGCSFFAALGFLGLLLPGHIEANFFTVIIGIICLIVVFVGVYGGR